MMPFDALIYMILFTMSVVGIIITVQIIRDSRKTRTELLAKLDKLRKHLDDPKLSSTDFCIKARIILGEK